MTLTDMEKAIQDAEAELRRADMTTTQLARLLVGRLRTIRSWSDRCALVELKRELKGFNSTYRTWREKA